MVAAIICKLHLHKSCSFDGIPANIFRKCPLELTLFSPSSTIYGLPLIAFHISGNPLLYFLFSRTISNHLILWTINLLIFNLVFGIVLWVLINSELVYIESNVPSVAWIVVLLGLDWQFFVSESIAYLSGYNSSMYWISYLVWCSCFRKIVHG